jgi:hypothetical protein
MVYNKIDASLGSHQLHSMEDHYRLELVRAVLLTNGQVFFGKLEGLGTAYPVLREVYYIRTVPGSTDNTKATNVLVRRGQEWHAPDFMVINADHIMLVEPVTKDSRVAHLIAEQQQK